MVLFVPVCNSLLHSFSVKVCLADVSWGGWILPIVLHDEVWCLDIGGCLPRVVLSAKTLPLDQELEGNCTLGQTKPCCTSSQLRAKDLRGDNQR